MAQPGTTRTVGLALEGGGYRGMYTAGVLDVWMEHGLTCDHMAVSYTHLTLPTIA